MKRLAAPRAINVHRKESVWLKKPSAGPHDQSVALCTVLIEQLKIAENVRQAKKLLSKSEVLVNGKPVKDVAYPIGLMDYLQIPKLGKTYLMLFKKGRLFTQEAQFGPKLCRVMNKTTVKKGKIQLNLHDGTNYLIVKEEDRFAAGDTVKISVPGRELKGFMKLEKGANCYIYKGKHSGETAVLEELTVRKGSQSNEARLKQAGHEILTLKDYLFVVDQDFKVNK
ncbi:30S ribosomal protein S4e [Candidatus Micrarchaeota archaeon]|nr:30S ribosomal protein S4e [Candidatus Micrarchaeota archaeon]